MKNLSFLLVALWLTTATATAFAQTTTPAPDRSSDPTIGYPITDQLLAPAFQTFTENFPSQNVGFFHVYAKSTVDPLDDYLLKGDEASGTTKALLPEDFQRMAKLTNAKVYAAAAIKGVNENMYLVRYDSPTSDRVELFAIRDNEVVHLKTVAYRECTSAGCRQLDSYFTDVNGDGNLDLIQMKRLQTKKGDKGSRTTPFILDDRTRKSKKTKELELPVESLDFYDPRTDD